MKYEEANIVGSIWRSILGTNDIYLVLPTAKDPNNQEENLMISAIYPSKYKMMGCFIKNKKEMHDYLITNRAIAYIGQFDDIFDIESIAAEKW